MPSIQELPNKDGSISYKVWIRVKGAAPQYKTLQTRFEAEEYAKKEELRLRELVRKRHSKSAKDFYKETFTDTLSLFRATLIEKHADWYTVNKVIRIIGRSGPTIEDLRPSFCQDFVAKALKTKSQRGSFYAASTVATFMTIMSRAYKWRALKFNADPKGHPFSNSYLPKGWAVERDRRLEKEEEIALRLTLRKAKLGQQWLCYLNMALETGARLQEVIWATWSEFDLDRGVWLIPKEHTKAKKARPVPLTERAVLALRLMARFKKPSKANRVFYCFSNPPMVSHAFAKYVKATKIKDFHLHDLRHEAITRMVLYRRDVSVYEIMKIVGHSSIEMLDRYTNLRGDELVDRFRGKKT